MKTRRGRKQPLMPAWLVFKFFMSILLVLLTMSIYSKQFHKNIAHANYISPLAGQSATLGSKTVGVSHKVTQTLGTEPSVTPTPTPYKYDTAGAINRIWGKDAPIGIAISSCESGTNPDKYHINDDGSIDFSVFQVNTVHGIILDPEENIRYAYKLYQAQGLTPWESSKHCWRAKLQS